jgi:hypothetical protein
MAFFDNNIFSPQSYQGGMSNWLVDALRSGLLGRAIPQQDQPTSMGNYGGVQYPVFGQAPQQPATNELSAQAAQQPIAPEPQQDFITRLQSNISPGWAQLNAGGKPTDDIREFEYARRQGFKGTLADWMAHKRAGAGEFGLNPIYSVGPDGKPTIVQLGKSGKAIQSQFPPGVTPARDPIKMDAGTHWVILDPQTRQAVATVPKELAKAKEQEKFGTLQGEARGELASQTSKMPGLEKVVSHLDTLSEKATYTIAGQAVDYAKRQLNMEPREASVARVEYEAVVNNQILPLLRDTFGAQFTEREGATLRATLGDPNKSPKEKQAVLRSFIEQKQRDIEALQRRTGERPATESAPSPKSAMPKIDEVRDGYRFRGGNPADPNSWVKVK